MYNVADLYACKSIVKDFSAIGRKIELTLNGDRETLNDLANTIVEGGYYLLSDLPGLSSDQQAIFTATALARTPRLVWDGQGLKADLVVYGEQGLKEGDSIVSDDGGDFSVPFNATSRFMFEPNDVALGYGLPFRAGYKWDLTVHASLGAADGILTALGYDATTISLLAALHVWESGAIEEQQRGVLYTALNANTSATEYLKRYLRGQTSYRFWVPHVTVTTRYRTMPQLETNPSFSKPGEITISGEVGAPPIWTTAPRFPDFGDLNDTATWYRWYASGPQIDFNGEFYSAEEQWQGFLDYDVALYGDPNS